MSVFVSLVAPAIEIAVERKITSRVDLRHQVQNQINKRGFAGEDTGLDTSIKNNRVG
jgi:hypothetical protein